MGGAESSAELIIENEFMRLYVHRDNGIIHTEIRRELEGKPFRDVLTRGAEILEGGTANKWLSDNRGHSRLSEADEDWAKTVWFPRARAAGWKHWAIVKPASAIGALNIARLAKNYASLGVNTRFFSNLDEALTWLREC
ncbi:MAG TPA: STAS/SEC14 domain-containing protein [Polyangiaceae bacterium]|jgi:hypothetical protein|nr:STAS/SEC14 domain-containing protein [Polyangiaceae bacterium]